MSKKTLGDAIRELEQKGKGKKVKTENEMSGGSISDFQYSLIDRMSSLYNQDFTEMINTFLIYASELSSLVNENEKNRIKRFTTDVKKIHNVVNRKIAERQEEREKEREKEQEEERL